MYLDTAVMVKLLVLEPDSEFYAALVHGQIVWSSQILVTECFSALLRKERDKAIRPAVRRRAWAQFEDYVADRRLNLIPFTTELAEQANRILATCHPQVALRSLDAIHLASAAHSRSTPLCSNDARMRVAAQRIGLPLAPVAP